MDRLARLLANYRRAVAAACAGLAVLAAIAAIRDVPDTSEVLVAARDLPSGHTVADADIQTARFPADTELTTLDEPEGQQVAGAMRAGEPFTDARVVDPRPTADGTVLATVPVDPAAATTLRAGDRVDVIAVSEQHDQEDQVLAEAATVVVVQQDEASTAVGVEATPDTAHAIARAALVARFTVVHAAS